MIDIMKFLPVFALAFTLSYGSAVEESANTLEYSKGLPRQLIREIDKNSIVSTLKYLHTGKASLRVLGPNLEETATLLNEDAEFIDYKYLRLIFRYKARYIMSAPDPMAELLKTMDHITEVFAEDDFERPLTCFLGLLASEGAAIFSPSIIPENSHQPIIKELLLKISVDELNETEHLSSPLVQSTATAIFSSDSGLLVIAMILLLILSMHLIEQSGVVIKILNTSLI
jgi:hypothetical protein